MREQRNRHRRGLRSPRLALAHHLVVLDNGSQDGTADILVTLWRRRGFPLEGSEDASPGQYQSQRMTCLMRVTCGRPLRADWVLLLDADEFLIVGKACLVPKNAAADRPLLLPWRTYVPHESDASEPNPLVRMRHSRVAMNGSHQGNGSRLRQG